MNFLRKIYVSLLIGLITLAAIVYFGIAYLIADTGYPGGISPQAENLLYAAVSFIFGFAGWAVVWKQKTFVRDLGRTIQGKWAVFWGFVTVALFWGAAIWFLVTSLKI